MTGVAIPRRRRPVPNVGAHESEGAAERRALGCDAEATDPVRMDTRTTVICFSRAGKKQITHDISANSDILIL